ncbi:MAG: PDZ domain-containing protein, partial [Gammaproteobacteria bacterium]|nr:PDZ domain-containing protein [Gammaproteobacteria bacterium]
GNAMQMLNPLPINQQNPMGAGMGLQMQPVAAQQGPPIQPNAPIPGNHKRDGRGKVACESCHAINGGGKWQGQLLPAAMVVAAPQGPPIRPNAMPPANHNDGRDRMACATCHQIIGAGQGAGQGVGQGLGQMQAPAAMSQPQSGFQPPALAMTQQMPMAQPVAAVNSQLYFEGAVLEPLDPLLVSQLNAQVSDGAFIATVYPDTAADQAGLKAGDIVFKLNGRWVLTPQELLQRAADYTVGDNLRLGVYRGKERLNLGLTLTGQIQPMAQTNAAAPIQNPGAITELLWIGMELKPITPALLAKKPELLGKKGTYVNDVDRLSLAAQYALQKGDIIKRINGVAVNSLDELERAINAANLNQGVLLLLERNGRALYMTIKQ